MGPFIFAAVIFCENMKNQLDQRLWNKNGKIDCASLNLCPRSVSFAGNCVYFTHVATVASRATSLNGMGLESSAQKQCNFHLLSVSVSVAFAIHSFDAKMEFTCSIRKRKIIRMVKRFTYISRSGIECLNSHMSGTVSCSPNATHFIIACSLCYALTLLDHSLLQYCTMEIYVGKKLQWVFSFIWFFFALLFFLPFYFGLLFFEF